MEEKTNFELSFANVDAQYRACRTRTERKRLGGHCNYSEYNIGVWFDSRNPKWAQPDHPIWQGNDQWGMRAPVVLAYFKRLNGIP